MKCPSCNLEAFIKASRYVIEGDNSDEETKLFNEQDLVCMNPKCNSFNQVISTVRNPIKIG